MFSERVLYLHGSDQNPAILAMGCEDDFLPGPDFFHDLDHFIHKHRNSYLFGCFSYDLKNRIEHLGSKHQDITDFPEIVLWKPKLVVEIKEQDYQILQGKTDQSKKEVIERFLKTSGKPIPNLEFISQISKGDYLKAIENIKQEIRIGNIYELNFCQQFIAQSDVVLDSPVLFQHLVTLTQAPFSAYVNLENHEVFCGSPERFLQKKGNQLMSQPIKGTSKKGQTPEEDRNLIHVLQDDPKERAENIMITDLVRNDLSRIAAKGSVTVDELCQVYSFGTVHQLISTVSCRIKENIPFSEILKSTFPMGSMTGAPKIKAMELIEKYETFKRGLYSGSIAYFKPNGDFDMNVVIRTLIRNKKTNVFAAAAGGAITIQSDAKKEYHECFVKIQKLLDLFKHDPL